MAHGKMIFLNGPSSVGKTTLAKALQQTLDEPFLYTGTDHFFLMLPSRSWEVGEAFRFVFGENGEPLELTIGSAGRHLIAGMVSAIAALADSGNHVIVETGFWGEELQACINGWARLNPLFVGIGCPLAIMEQREEERGNRLRGLARLQEALVPRHGIYDIEVDTSCMSAIQCAEAIKARLQSSSSPTALRRLIGCNTSLLFNAVEKT